MLEKIQKLLRQSGVNKYLVNTTWMFAEQMMRMVAGLFVGIWVARYLGPFQFGVFNYAIALSALFGNLAKLGLDNIVVRDLIQNPGQNDSILGTAFWLKLVGAVGVLFVISGVLLLASADYQTNLYICIISCGVIFQSFEVVDFYFQSKVLSKFVSICKLVQLFLSSLLKLYLIASESELLSFVVVSLFDQIALAISLYFAYRYKVSSNFYNRFSVKVAKSLLKDSWPLILSGFVIMIYMRIDQIMIKEFLGDRQVGFYSSAVRISEIWYFIPTIIANSVFPSIVAAKKIGADLYYSRIQRLYSFMFWSSVSIALPMSMLGEDVVVLLYGESYRAAGSALVIHIWAGVFVFLGVASSRWFISEGLQRYSTINTVAGVVCNILLNLLFIPRFGITGAALATVVSQFFASYFMNLFFLETRSNFFRLTKAVFFPTFVRR